MRNAPVHNSLIVLFIFQLEYDVYTCCILYYILVRIAWIFNQASSRYIEMFKCFRLVNWITSIHDFYQLLSQLDLNLVAEVEKSFL